MIICVNMVGKAIHNMGLDKDAARPPAPSPAPGTPPQVTAAITAAVKEYRNNGEGQ